MLLNNVSSTYTIDCKKQNKYKILSHHDSVLPSLHNKHKLKFTKIKIECKTNNYNVFHVNKNVFMQLSNHCKFNF